MKNVLEFLIERGLPPGELYELPTSEKRFPDGAQYRIEIPSVEGPRALIAVLEAAEEYGVTVHRISQGSGIGMLTDDEIREMCRLGAEAGIEVSLFVGTAGGLGHERAGAGQRGQRTWARGCGAWTRSSTPPKTSCAAANWACARSWSPTRGSSGWSQR